MNYPPTESNQVQDGRPSMEPLVPPSYTPTSLESYTSETKKFEPPTKHHDIWAIIVFILFLIGQVGLGIYLIFGTSLRSHSFNLIGDMKGLASLAVSLLVSIGFSFFYLILVRCMPRVLIHLSFISSILLLIGSAVLAHFNHRIVLIVIFSILALIALIVYIISFSKIALTAKLLILYTRFTFTFPAVFLVAFFYLLAQLLYLAFWVFSIAKLVATYAACDKSSFKWSCFKSMPIISWVYLGLSVFVLFWFSQVLKDLLNLTVAGSFSAHYFHADLPNPTHAAFKRASTTSFGTACFGSLLLSIIRFIRFIVSALANSQDGPLAFIVCCIDCILGCIEGMIEFINQYAYAYCAIYGLGFVEGGKKAINLIKQSNVNLIINDNMVTGVLSLGALLCGLISVVLTFLYFMLTHHEGAPYMLGYIIINFIVAIILFILLTQPIEASNSAFMVCIADSPSLLKDFSNSLYEMINVEYPEFFGPSRIQHDE